MSVYLRPGTRTLLSRARINRTRLTKTSKTHRIIRKSMASDLKKLPKSHRPQAYL